MRTVPTCANTFGDSITGVRGRRVVLACAAGVLAVAVAVVALWPVYVRPRVDPPAPADAILVLGGAHDGREELGLRLAREGYAPLVLFSDPYDGSARMNRICHGGYSFEVRCFDPDPRTTRGGGPGTGAVGARGELAAGHRGHLHPARLARPLRPREVLGR